MEHDVTQYRMNCHYFCDPMIFPLVPSLGPNSNGLIPWSHQPQLYFVFSSFQDKLVNILLILCVLKISTLGSSLWVWYLAVVSIWLKELLCSAADSWSWNFRAQDVLKTHSPFVHSVLHLLSIVIRSLKHRWLKYHNIKKNTSLWPFWTFHTLFQKHEKWLSKNSIHCIMFETTPASFTLAKCPTLNVRKVVFYWDNSYQTHKSKW